MRSDFAYILLFLAGGAFLAVHCARAAFREYRAVVGLGRFGKYRRSDQPFRFWMTIAGNGLAALMGILFLVIGIAALADGM